MRDKRKRNRERMQQKAEKRRKLQKKSQFLAGETEGNENVRQQSGNLDGESEHLDNGLLFTEDVSNKITRIYTLGIKVEKPEFNINDYENKCQILFASDKECFITFSQEFLEYDLFEQDSKKTVKCGFSDLQLFTVPPNINTENRIFWLEDTLTQPFMAHSRDNSSSEDVSQEESNYSETSGDEEIDKSIFDNFLDADPVKLEKASQKVMSKRGFSVAGSVTSRRNRSVSRHTPSKGLNAQIQENRRSKSKLQKSFLSSHKNENSAHNEPMRILLNDEDIKFSSQISMKSTSQKKIQSAKKLKSPHRSNKIDIDKRKSSLLDQLPKKAENVHNFIRKGILNRIIYCEKATFRYISFKNSTSIIDFSKRITPENIQFMEDNEGRQGIWNGRFRTNRFIANIGLFTSVMSSQDFEIFFIMNSFLMSMMGQNQDLKKENLDQRHRRMLAELKEIGTDGLQTYIESKIKEKDQNKKKMMNSVGKKTNFEYLFDKIELLMTEGEKEFLKIIIRKCHGKHVFSSSGQNDITFGIKDLEIDNAMVDTGEHAKVLKRSLNHRNNQNQAVLINQSYFTVPGVNPINRWKVVSNYEIMVTPLRVDITKDIYEKLSNYIFRKETERLQKKIDEDLETQKLYVQNPELYFKIREMTLKKHKELYLKEKNKNEKGQPKKNTAIQIPPTYYKRVRLSEMRLVVTFRSNSLLMVSYFFNFFSF